MSDPISYIIPVVGSSGVFILREPFAEKIQKNVSYTCQGLRRISEYLANNENPQETIYTANKIADSVYTEDLANDTQIASLQGETGQWLYIPVRYIISYPNPNGVKYRSLALSVALPSMPVDRSYSSLEASIRNIVREQLGVDCVIEKIETSKITLVPIEKHHASEVSRGVISGTPSTDRGLYVKTLQQLTDARAHIATLEKYITDHVTVPDL